jgi:hypothetical protein
MSRPDLLMLIAEDPSLSAVEDADRIRSAILADGRAHNGLIDSNRVRESLRNHDPLANLDVFHKRIGAQYSALRQRGLIVRQGYIESTDTRGGNAGKPVPRWRLTEAGWAS